MNSPKYLWLTYTNKVFYWSILEKSPKLKENWTTILERAGATQYQKSTWKETIEYLFRSHLDGAAPNSFVTLLNTQIPTRKWVAWTICPTLSRTEKDTSSDGPTGTEYNLRRVVFRRKITGLLSKREKNESWSTVVRVYNPVIFRSAIQGYFPPLLNGPTFLYFLSFSFF